MKFQVVVLMLLLAFTFSFSQTLRITKIIDTNLFELNNNQKIRLYGIYIPSVNDTVQRSSELAQTIYSWENKTFLNNEFNFEMRTLDRDSIYFAIASLDYPFSKYDMAGQLIFRGYAGILDNAGKDFYEEHSLEQERAQHYKLGIWDNNISKENNVVVGPSTGRFNPPMKPANMIVIITGGIVTMFLGTQMANKWLRDEPTTKFQDLLMGATFIASAGITAIMIMKALEVKSDLHSVTVSYNF